MQTKWLVSGVFMLILTGVIGYWLGKNFSNSIDPDLFSQKPTTSIVAEETISSEVAQQQREEHYQKLTSISEVLALPSLFSQQEALHAIAGRADKIQLHELINDAAAVADSQQRATLLQVLVTRLIEIDPQTAANIAIDAYQNKNYSLLSLVYQHWAKLNLDAAIQSANNIKDNSHQSTAAQGVVAAISVNDIQLITDVSKQLGIQTSEELYVSNALIESAAQDPEVAMQQAMVMPLGYERDSALQGIADTWAAQDPEQAFTFVETIADKRVRQQLIESVLYRWAEADPEVAYEVLQQLPTENQTSNISYTLFTFLANQDPNKALDIIENIPSSRNRYDAYTATIQSWAANDAQSAARYVAQLNNKQLKQQLAPTIIQNLSTQSPDTALAWAQEQDPTGQQYLQNTVVSQIATDDPDRALQIALSSQQPALRQQLVVAVINSLSYNDPVRAASMVDQIPDTDINAETINTVVYSWTNSDPDAAMAWVNSKRGTIREEGLMSIGSQLASVNPELAASYLPQLSGDVRENWAQNIVYNYSSYDLAEAVTWVENFRGEAVYDVLISSVIGTAASTDVDYALQLAQDMPSPAQRNQMVRQIADQISYNDPQRAEQLYARLPQEDNDNESEQQPEQ